MPNAPKECRHSRAIYIASVKDSTINSVRVTYCQPCRLYITMQRDTLMMMSEHMPIITIGGYRDNAPARISEIPGV